MKKSLLTRKIHADSVILLIGILLLSLFCVTEILLLSTPLVTKPPLERASLLLVICLLLYLGVLLHCHRVQSPLMMRRLTVLVYVLYLYFLISITLLDKSLGRDSSVIHLVNFVPFHSIYNIYIMGYINGWLNLYYVLLNLLGNLVAFVPFAILTPVLFRTQQKWYVFLPTTILTVCAIEAAQYLLWVGCTDVDDLILNLLGAMTVFGIMRIPPIKRLINRLLCEERLI